MLLAPSGILNHCSSCWKISRPISCWHCLHNVAAAAVVVIFSTRWKSPTAVGSSLLSLFVYFKSSASCWLAAAPLSSASVSRVVDDAALGGNCV